MEVNLKLLTKVNVQDIHTKLNEQWTTLKNANFVRACLFNLIVYCKDQKEYGYYESLVHGLMKNYPCRVFFILEKDESPLATFVDVRTFTEGSSTVSCDYISFKLSTSDANKIPYLLLPHIVPDLPVFLFWPFSPSHSNFEHLTKLSTRVLLSSALRSADEILHKDQHSTCSFSDLNWLYTKGWRHCLSQVFLRNVRLESLQKASSISIEYNSTPLPFNSKTDILAPALYLQAWLASRLKWELVKRHKDVFTYQKSNSLVDITLISTSNVSDTAIQSVKIQTTENELFDLNLTKNEDSVLVNIHSEDSCKIPYKLPLNRHMWERSVWEEMYQSQTSPHYLSSLALLAKGGPYYER